MDRLRDLVGVERSVTGVSQALHLAVAERRPPTVGAMHITCADESENECVQAFLKGFVQYVVPPLKFGERSAVRIANLGGRYEWGAIRIAEQHYALVESGGADKLLVVKVNAHVAGQRERGVDTFGVLKRYASDSPCCGALHELLTGDHSPYV